ncbi:MAG: hypothetical protein AAF597_03855 [Bacteroidota bacterium]
MTKVNFLITGLILLFTTQIAGQSSPLPFDDDGYELLRRLNIRYGFDGFQRPATDLSLRPGGRAGLVRLAKTYQQRYGAQMSKVDNYRLQRFFDNNNEWLSLDALGNTEDGDRAAFFLGDDFALQSAKADQYRKTNRKLLNLFYPTPAHLLEVNQPDFYLRLNPIVDLRYGKQQNDAEDYFFNRRGVALRAGIDDRVFFHFDILETQVGLPDYVRQFRQRFGSLPGAGFLKPYTFEALNVNNGVDYLNGTGYVSVDLTKHIGARLGYGRHFIGDGERSMLLSNFSNNYPYLELNWRIWKFHYRNIFAELTAGPGSQLAGNNPFPKKYLASHHLSINLGKRLTVGLFEAVIFNRETGFDLAYLNPVILYRTIEQSVGSPDNAMIGLTARYQTKFRTEVYGQFILDEFKFDELFLERRGWWANKWAYQLGLRHVDAFGIDQLDIVAERNVARPYTFTHRELASYSHFAMPLAHPLGANFNENLLGIDYRPLPRLHLRSRLYLIEQGEETETEVVGENINISHNERGMDFGNEIGQGNNYTNTLLTLRASFELKPNLWLEGEFISRAKDSQLDSRDLQTTLINFGVRWNVAREEREF